MSTIRVKRSTSSTAPSGLTFGEPAFVDGINSLYVAKNDGTSLRVGAEIDTTVTLGTSDNKIPTQKAVKVYVDNNIAGGSISSLNGLTGAVNIYGGSGVSVAAAAGGITLTNTGVVSAVAGTGISVSAATGAVTFTNTGVQSAVAGNQITVSGATGAVTVAVTATPSFTTISTSGDGTVGGNLVVTGNLTINGTTTTVNSNTMTIDDPLLTLGTSGGLPISASDSGKDRGIVFNYYDTAGRTGFFGWDASAAEFVFQKNSTVTGEVVTGVSYGNLHVASLVLQNGAVTPDTVIGSAAGNQTHTFRDYGGTIVTVNGEPTTGYILKGNSLGAHTWQNPNAAGFTAFAATSLATARTFSLTGDVTATGITFDGTGNVTLSTTIAANSVALGTDTTGNYAQDVSVAGLGLTISGAAGEGTQYIITSGATSANTASQIVARDASGNFTAGTITANLTGNVSGSAATLTTSRTIGLTGDIFGSASFNGSADATITATIAAGSILDADINASAGIVDTKLATISTANKVSISALDIDGATSAGNIVGADLLIVDDGANGTNRKVTVDNLFGSTSTAIVDGGTY